MLVSLSSIGCLQSVRQTRDSGFVVSFVRAPDGLFEFRGESDSVQCDVTKIPSRVETYSSSG